MPDDPIAVLCGSAVVTDMGVNMVDDGGISFLLPDGRCLIAVDGVTHASIADAAGTSMRALNALGVARFYLRNNCLGIEIWQPLSRRQIATLLKAVRVNYVTKFELEGAHDIHLQTDSRSMISKIIEALASAYG